MAMQELPLRDIHQPPAPPWWPPAPGWWWLAAVVLALLVFAAWWWLRARRRRAAIVRLFDERLHAANTPVERVAAMRSEEHTSELQSPMRISYAVFCLKKKKKKKSRKRNKRIHITATRKCNNKISMT